MSKPLLEWSPWDEKYNYSISIYDLGIGFRATIDSYGDPPAFYLHIHKPVELGNICMRGSLKYATLEEARDGAEKILGEHIRRYHTIYTDLRMRLN